MCNGDDSRYLSHESVVNSEWELFGFFLKFTDIGETQGV